MASVFGSDCRGTRLRSEHQAKGWDPDSGATSGFETKILLVLESKHDRPLVLGLVAVADSRYEGFSYMLIAGGRLSAIVCDCLRLSAIVCDCLRLSEVARGCLRLPEVICDCLRLSEVA